jgi:hypothetical protein
VLSELPLHELITAIAGAITGPVKANAELKAAKSMKEPTKSMDNFVVILMAVIPVYSDSQASA